MATKIDNVESSNNILNFLNIHSKKVIIATVILVGATLTATGALWYYRNDLKVERTILDKKAPSKQEIESGKVTSTLGGTVVSISANSVVIKEVSGTEKNLKISSNTSFLKGVDQEKGSLEDISVGLDVTVGYNAESNNIYNFSY